MAEAVEVFGRGDLGDSEIAFDVLDLGVRKVELRRQTPEGGRQPFDRLRVLRRGGVGRRGAGGRREPKVLWMLQAPVIRRLYTAERARLRRDVATTDRFVSGRRERRGAWNGK